MKYANWKPIAYSYSMADAMFAISGTVYELYAVETCMTSTLSFRMGQVQI